MPTQLMTARPDRVISLQERRMCQHLPTCPTSTAPDREAAKVVSSHPEQGWRLQCNGVILFEDTGYILPVCSSIGPHGGCTGLVPAQRMEPVAACPMYVTRFSA